jgi:hypothetical protein
MHITEGKKEVIRISMPNGLSIPEIAKVEIHDQSGNAWNVKWLSARKLTTEGHHEQLHESEESNCDRVCKISGYSTADKYCYARFCVCRAAPFYTKTLSAIFAGELGVIF